MTISGSLLEAEMPSTVELVPARLAQPYVSSLEAELTRLDGGPVMLVHDGETGTSDLLVEPLVTALQEQQDVESLAVTEVMTQCFAHGASFRVWWAGGSAAQSHVEKTVPVSCLSEALAALNESRDVSFHAVEIGRANELA